MHATPPSRVLITGSTGFVGRSLLATPAPLTWRAALRAAPAGGAGPDEVVVGNIDANTDWSVVLAGIDAVVHLAARVHVMQPTAADRLEFDRTNILGTERLARAALQAGVKRFVFLSSIKVNGESTAQRAFHADDVPQPQDDYARSKLEAEQRLASLASASAMAVSVVRPPLVYGPGVRANFLRLLSLAHSGLPLPLASIANQRSMVSIWNLCDLICSLLRSPEPRPGTFLVADAENVSTPDLFRRLAHLMRRPARLWALPVGTLRAAAALLGRGAEIDRLSQSLRIDITSTRDRLGWSPPLTLEQGLARTVEWYMQRDPRRQS